MAITKTADQQILDLLGPVDILALTIWGEARGENLEGRAAVGCVIRNRVATPRRFGQTYREVCLKLKQFSCWNQGDPNRGLLMAMARLLTNGSNPDGYAETRWLADGIIEHYVSEHVAGATHYLTRSLYDSAKCPSWAKGVQPKALIGQHVFLKVK